METPYDTYKDIRRNRRNSPLHARFCMGQSAVQAYTNEDGVLRIAEVQAVYPDMTEEAFATADLNGDGVLEDAEVTAAQEAGLMPAS